MLYTVHNRVQFHIDDENDAAIRESFRWFEFTHSTQLGMAEEMRGFLNLAASRRCLIDIGSCFGMFSLAFTIYPDQIAYAIEPAPEPFEIIRRHAACNPGRNIIPHRACFSDSIGTVAVAKEWVHYVATDHSETIIPTTTLDAFCRDNNVAPDCLKIDVEGMEAKVLRGGRETLAKCRPLIFLELHHDALQASHDDQAIAEILRESRYNVCDVHMNRIADVVRHISDVQGHGRHYSHVVCIPQ